MLQRGRYGNFDEERGSAGAFLYKLLTSGEIFGSWMLELKAYHSVLQWFQNVLQWFPVVKQMTQLSVKIFSDCTIALLCTHSIHFRPVHNGQAPDSWIFFWTQCPAIFSTVHVCPVVFSAKSDMVLFTNFVYQCQCTVPPPEEVSQCSTTLEAS